MGFAGAEEADAGSEAGGTEGDRDVEHAVLLLGEGWLTGQVQHYTYRNQGEREDGGENQVGGGPGFGVFHGELQDTGLRIDQKSST